MTTSSTWEETNQEIEYIKRRFVEMHDIGEKNWNEHQRAYVVYLRSRCRELSQIRYDILKERTYA